MAEEKAALVKVCILCDNDKIMLGGILPDSDVSGVLEADFPHMLGTGIFLL